MLPSKCEIKTPCISKFLWLMLSYNEYNTTTCMIYNIHYTRRICRWQENMKRFLISKKSEFTMQSTSCTYRSELNENSLFSNYMYSVLQIHVLNVTNNTFLHHNKQTSYGVILFLDFLYLAFKIFFGQRTRSRGI